MESLLAPNDKKKESDALNLKLILKETTKAYAITRHKKF